MSLPTESEYFFHGSSHPDLSGQHIQYGLFNAVDDCFVLTSERSDVVLWLSFLFSSRYNLAVYQLDTAENFFPGIIDNEICTGWTIGNDELLGFTRFNNWKTVLPIKKLSQRAEPMHPGSLKNDIPYLMAAHHWVDKCLQRKKETHIDHIVMSTMIDMPLSDLIVNMCNHVFMTIYQETDFQQAKSQIRSYEQNNFFPVDLF